MTQAGTGGYFSRSYLRTQSPSSDDAKMRRRFIRFYKDVFSGESGELGRYIERELGLSMISLGPAGYYVSWEEVFSKLPIEDVLDILTATYRYFDSPVRSDKDRELRNFVKFAERVFREQNLAYRLDDRAGVHPFVDVAFSTSFGGAVSSLAGPEFSAARHYVEQSEGALLATNMDTRLAVRAIFDAVENLFKLMCPSQTQLNKDGIRRALGPVIDATLKVEPHEVRARSKIISALEAWVDAGHFYRHEPGKPEPSRPSTSFAVVYLSSGFSYVRFLAEVRKAMAGSTVE